MTTLPRVRRAVAVSVAALLAATVGPAAAAAGSTPEPVAAHQVARPGLYIVALETPPPRPDRPRAQEAAQDAQDALLDGIGSPEVLYRFTAALNGFAAQLNRAQVKQLRADPDVALVERSTVQRLDSVDGPSFLGADEAWASLGGPDHAGRDVVIGVVDSGIWPENPSFAALPGAATRTVRGFRGACAAGDQWDGGDCNSKIVGARYFVKGFGKDDLAASEYLSPRDSTGHGSHVAAVAAGNDGVDVRVDGQSFGAASGMAPGARIAAYKACWAAPDPSRDGCTTADTVAAVDQAVTDGVDVLSFAMSARGQDSEAMARAFLNATAAGVFVTASAGNRGPAAESVANSSPWVTTVGANTHHSFEGAVVLGDGERYVGAMVSDERVPSAELVLAEDAPAPASSRQDARLCRPGSLDAAEVEGRIVVCDRGTVARVDKSTAVERAGGVGMVLANVTPDTVASDFHAVPTVHLDVAAAREVKQYLADTPDATAWLDPRATADTPVPQIASFSSRGPGRLGDRGALLKPDVTAPGVGVLSAVAPPGHDGRLWDQYSGTSMSTAAVAGLAAVVRSSYPRWTPAMVRSAITTSADDLTGVSGPLAEGAGQVDATEMLDPGLVFDAAPSRFRAWLDGEVASRSLNLPSIAVDDLTGRARVSRRVVNVASTTETYTAQVSGMRGVDVRVRPQTLTLGPGESGQFTVVLEHAGAQPEVPARGTLIWTGLSHEARMPLVATPRSVVVPQEATGSGESGTVSFEGLSGTSEAVEVEVAGLTEARPVGLTLEPGDEARFPVTVPAQTRVLRLALLGRDSDDMDLALYRDGQLVSASTGTTADEVVTEVAPEAGEYELVVSSTVAGNGATTTGQLYTWVVPGSDAGNLEVPESIAAAPGDRFGVDVSWSGLDPTSRWFGMLEYDGSHQRTFVTIN